jgi:hypothetical protein
VDRGECAELHYITPLANLPSMLEIGVLSHRLADRIPHASVAMEQVQDLRAGVTVPKGRRLHDYANFYLNARNAMMYVRSDEHAELAILRIDSAALDISDVVVSDMNAAVRDYAAFGTPEEMLPKLSRERIFARYWNHEDFWEKVAHKRAMCAEVLVPRSLPPEYIVGAYVSCDQSKSTLAAAAPSLVADTYPYMFFRGNPR